MYIAYLNALRCSCAVDVPWKLVLMRERAAYDPAYSSLYETYEAQRSSLMEALKEAESTEECAAERPVLVAACHLIKALLAPKPECRPSAASSLSVFLFLFNIAQCLYEYRVIFE